MLSTDARFYRAVPPNRDNYAPRNSRRELFVSGNKTKVNCRSMTVPKLLPANVWNCTTEIRKHRKLAP